MSYTVLEQCTKELANNAESLKVNIGTTSARGGGGGYSQPPKTAVLENGGKGSLI